MKETGIKDIEETTIEAVSGTNATDLQTSEAETCTKDKEPITQDTVTDIKQSKTHTIRTETSAEKTYSVASETEMPTNLADTATKETETSRKASETSVSYTEALVIERETSDSETDTETETETPRSNPDTSSSASRKINTISNCEILAQMKNRHEEIVLNSRLRSLHSNQCRKEESLARTRKQLIETMRRSKRTSGSSPDPFVSDESVTPLIYKYYQAPWAYSFNETTHNSLYKEIEQLPKRSFKQKGQRSNARLAVKSAPSHQRTVPSLIERSCPASNVDINGYSNETQPFLRFRRKPIMRPHSCALPMQTKDTVDKDSVLFNEETRPYTCKHNSGMNHRQVERKQSWIKPISRAMTNPITDTLKEEENNEMTEDEFVSKYLGNSDKVNPYRYLNRKKGGLSQTVYRGQKLKNYIRPQDRYKKDPLNLIKREKMVLKLSMADSESLEQSRKAALKAGEAFPKAARLRMLNELIASNNDKSEGPYIDYNIELQARIEHFLNSIEDFCESRSTSSYDTRAGSVHH